MTGDRPPFDTGAGRLGEPGVRFDAPLAGAAALPSAAGRFNEPEVRFDAQLAVLAPARHAVFALDELRALGLTARSVQKRCAAGRLHRVHRGVYAVVPPALLTVAGRYRAATLAATGRRARHPAALSHRSGADLLELRECHRRTIDVIVPGRSPHRNAGVQTHRSINLDAERDITVVDGIPVTTVARTLLDLAGVLPRRAIERALDQAEVLRVFDLVALQDQLQRNPGHPGAGRLRAVLATHTAGDIVTDSALEERLHALLANADVPRPVLHGAVDPGDGGPLLRPDFTWHPQRLALEVDGRATHLTRHAFEHDRHRDQRLTAAGWRVIRITWRQLHDDPQRITRLLAELVRPHANTIGPVGGSTRPAASSLGHVPQARSLTASWPDANDPSA